ncbi:MAG: nucleotidyltransferase domain-containing protein [Kiritimatiellae bacterium]|nr:nucleotidyltransferase domain-containing protein [Kiritimatiellia bacterium]
MSDQGWNELVSRIVGAVHPLQIILFGSSAREGGGVRGDVDVLVVMPDGTPRRATAQKLHLEMFGLPFAVDILVATPSDLQRHRTNIGLIYKTILEEGKQLYAA